jgi:probable HAF family extracellular repeat protein
MKEKQNKQALISCPIKSTVAQIMLGLAISVPVSAYELVDLGADIEPLDINNNQIVVGARFTNQYPTVAFKWTPNTGFENLDGTVAKAVNDSGVITGNTLTGAFYYDGNITRYLGDDYTGNGINSLGSVAGSKSKPNPYRATPRPVDPAIYDPNANGQKWSVLDVANVYSRGTRQGVYADLYTLVAINDAGFAVGRKSRYGLSGSSAFMTTPAFDSVTFLSIPNGGNAVAINNANQIVGSTGTNTSLGEYSFAYLYEAGNITNLGTLPSNGEGSEPGLTSYAYDINDLSQVVGSSWLVTALTSLQLPEKYHAFIWDNGQMSDLNDLVQLPTGWILTRASAINENGDIVGVGLKDGIAHGFVLANDQLPPPSQNQPPVAIASANVIFGKIPLAVNFIGSDSYDMDGSIIDYQWDFGDGTSASTANPSHIYDMVGNFTATLTVTDDKDLHSSATVLIETKKRKGRR